MITVASETRHFGTTNDGRAVTRIDLTAVDGSGVALLDLGAAVLEVRVQDRNGRLANVALGHRDLAGYLAVERPARARHRVRGALRRPHNR